MHLSSPVAQKQLLQPESDPPRESRHDLQQVVTFLASKTLDLKFLQRHYNIWMQ